MDKQKLINCLVTNTKLWNRYVSFYFSVNFEWKANLSGADLRRADLSEAKNKYILMSGLIGSRNDITYYVIEDDYIQCGCFKGTFKEFIKQVKKNYDVSNVYYKQYMMFAKYCKSITKIDKEKK